MKNIFYLLLTTLLFVFVANSPTFAHESDYDQVKVEQSIYCPCAICYVSEIETQIEKEFAQPLLHKMQIQDYCLLCSYFLDGNKFRDNVEGENQSYNYTNYNIQSSLIVDTATDAKRDREINKSMYSENNKK